MKTLKNPSNTQHHELPKTCPAAAAAYAELTKAPDDSRCRERFGRCLDDMLVELLPSTADHECVHSEKDLRQDAHALLFGSYLDGNRRLQDAVRLHDIPRIQQELTRSVLGAVTVAHKRRLQKNLSIVAFEERVHGQLITVEDDSAHQRDARWRSRTEQLLRLAEERSLISPQEILIVRKLVVDEVGRSIVGNAYGLNAVELTRLLQKCSLTLARLAHELGWREIKPLASAQKRAMKRLQP